VASGKWKKIKSASFHSPLATGHSSLPDLAAARPRYNISGSKKGEWREVEFRAIEARVGWAMDGPSLEGHTLDNFKLLFQGGTADRILLDDVEIPP
jgi:hypothetical protein